MNPSKNDANKFMEKVNVTGDCWEWSASHTNTNGYGEFYFNRKKFSAHRASYLIFKGEIPAGLNVCHSCDNPSCVNPDHLFLGTQVDNMRDMIKKGRQKFIKIDRNVTRTYRVGAPKVYTLRLPVRMRDRVEEAARNMGVSMNEFVNLVLDEKLRKKD